MVTHMTGIFNHFFKSNMYSDVVCSADIFPAGPIPHVKNPKSQ